MGNNTHVNSDKHTFAQEETETQSHSESSKRVNEKSIHSCNIQGGVKNYFLLKRC